MKKKILFQKGRVESLYDDDLAQTLLQKLGGDASVKRASHVEAVEGNHKTIAFTVDLTPSQGPILTGFTTYKDAVNAEIDWLHTNKITTKH